MVEQLYLPLPLPTKKRSNVVFRIKKVEFGA
jgi:hypothetical protein